MNNIRIAVLFPVLSLICSLNACAQYPMITSGNSYRITDSVEVKAEQRLDISWCFDFPGFSGGIFTIETKKDTLWSRYSDVGPFACRALLPGNKLIFKGGIMYRFPAPGQKGIYRVMTVNTLENGAAEYIYSNEFVVE